jgi:RimJ/RimL family protein N-acetyltransferase
MAMRDDVTLTTERLVLREPRLGDDLALSDYYARNAERFERFEAPRSTERADDARSIALLRADADRTGRTTTLLVVRGVRPRE